MENNTITTLNKLRKGDRFYFTVKPLIAKRKVQSDAGSWQVIEPANAKGRVIINQVSEVTRQKLHEKDTVKKGSSIVHFLRHTVPVPGEKIFIMELKPGSVFKKPDDNKTEWIVVRHNSISVDISKRGAAVNEKAGKYALVIFVR